MNDTIENFKMLTLWSDKVTITNLLEGTLYLSNFYKLNKILKFLQKNKIKFDIISGFKGNNDFKKSNEFNSCVLELKNEVSIEKLNEFINGSNLYKSSIKGTKVQIKLIK